MRPPIALTIAGSDSGGGAGVQADLRTFALFGVHGTTAITALTAQNTTGVKDVFPSSAEMVRAQMDAVLSDMPVLATKTGMLATRANVEVVASYDLPNLVVDPIIISSSGHALLRADAIDAYKQSLLPRACVVTPNVNEATVLTGIAIATVGDMQRAARALQALGPSCVVVTGSERGVDVVVHEGDVDVLTSEYVETANSHGTGCTFSAAITAALATGVGVGEAISSAKRITHEALVAGKDMKFGGGSGPVWLQG